MHNYSSCVSPVAIIAGFLTDFSRGSMTHSFNTTQFIRSTPWPYRCQCQCQKQCHIVQFIVLITYSLNHINHDKLFIVTQQSESPSMAINLEKWISLRGLVCPGSVLQYRRATIDPLLSSDDTVLSVLGGCWEQLFVLRHLSPVPVSLLYMIFP